eukprot:TRINITY_DN2934_c0_g3_i2.p1 TRINITY_DN2934_c0_g3~~TRINITY_DN2934_c0_g3_i2.p1  ORF type:complete len:1227 (-),score=265.45 TRINITY_DN2934_c0_g3_i2:188-3595(-)
MNKHCPSTSNMICVQNNAEFALGRLQSLFLPILDESEKDFRLATLTNNLDLNDRMGKSTGLDLQVIDELGVIYTSNILPAESLGSTYYEFFANIDDNSVDRVDTFLEDLYKASLYGDEMVSLSMTNGVRSCYAGHQMYRESDGSSLANIVYYTNAAAPLIPIHSVEVAAFYLSTHIIHNIQSFMGSAVQIVKEGSSMQQISLLFQEAQIVGVGGFIIYWDYVDGESIPSIIFKPAQDIFYDTFGIEDTELVKIPSTSPDILFSLIPEEEWDQMVKLSLDEFPDSQWAAFGWHGIDYFWNYQRTYDPETGNSMTIMFIVKDEFVEYDESCSIEETLRCSEAIMEAIMSIIVRDALLFDTQAMFTIASNNLLRTSGGIALIIWETDGKIIYNSIDSQISGLTSFEWEEKWEMPGMSEMFYEQVQAAKSLDGLLSRTPLHTVFKLGKDAPIIPVAVMADVVTISTTQFTFGVFHKIKPILEYDVEYKEMIEAGKDGKHHNEPDFCASFFEHDCSMEYAEYLIAKIYEGVVSLSFIGNGEPFNHSNNTLADHIKNLEHIGYLRESVLAAKFAILDYDVYIFDGDGIVLGSVNDGDEKVRLSDIYGVTYGPVYPPDTDIHDAVHNTGKIIKFGDNYDPYDGISAEDYWQSTIDYGCLPNAKDRQVEFNVELSNLQVTTFRQLSKAFQIDGVSYVLAVSKTSGKANAKCSEGCPAYSHCAIDGMFCVCDDNTVWPDSTIFECKPIHILQDPPEVRVYFYGAFIASVVITLAVSILLFLKRRTRLMRLSSYMITQVVILGVLMLYTGGLMFALPPEDYPSVCWQRPFWMISGLSVSLLALFLKTWRIQRLVNNIKMKRMKLDNSVLAKYMAIVMVPILTLLSLWLFVFYPDFGYYSSDVLPYENKSYAVCTERKELAAVVGLYLLAIIIWGGYNAQKSQNVPIGANESDAILKTLLLFLGCGLIFVPLNFMVADSNQQLMVIIRAFGCLVCALSVLFSIVGKKVNWLLRGYGNAEFLMQFDQAGGDRRGSALNKLRYKGSSSNGTSNSTSTRTRKSIDSIDKQTTSPNGPRYSTDSGKSISVNIHNGNVTTSTSMVYAASSVLFANKMPSGASSTLSRRDSNVTDMSGNDVTAVRSFNVKIN